MFELRRRSSRVILQVVLFLLTVPFLLPLVQMVIGALGGIGWRNFVVVWDTGVIPTFFRNSAILAASEIFRHRSISPLSRSIRASSATISSRMLSSCMAG